MSSQLPAVIVLDQTAVVNTGGAAAVPVVIAQAGEQASWRYVEFFTANMGVYAYRPEKGHSKHLWSKNQSCCPLLFSHLKRGETA